MHEFELIDTFRAVAGGAQGEGLLLGAGDDAALLEARAGEVLAISVDTALAGRHFPTGSPGDLIAWRALAMNLSDLAAMGAQPWCAFLALTLPEADVGFVRAMARGWRALASQHGLLLAGGNLTRGPLSLSVTVVGRVPAGGALRRSGARPGDAVWVSGVPGLAGRGLAAAHTAGGLDDLVDAAVARYWAPQPRIALGVELRDLATACIDVSDGLAADAGHLAAASGVCMELELDLLPGSGDPLAAACAGDDYELLFSAPAVHAARIEAAAADCGTPVTRIGRIRPGTGVRITLAGKAVDLPVGGWRHFD